MEITSTSELFERAIDIFGALPIPENGNRFIMTAQNNLTKFSFAAPMPNYKRINEHQLSSFIFDIRYLF